MNKEDLELFVLSWVIWMICSSNPKTQAVALVNSQEGAKRGAKSPALAAGFQQPVEIDEFLNFTAPKLMCTTDK